MTQRDEVRKRILMRAGEIFADRGFQSTTVREICQRAEVNVAAVNYYFGDKERLYIDAVKDARELIASRWPLPEWTSETSTEQKLLMFVTTFLQRLLNTDPSNWRMKLLLREILEPSRACEEMIQESFQPFFGVLLDIIREAVGPDVSEHQLHQTGFSVISQCVFYLANRRVVEIMVTPAEREEHFQTEMLAKHITQFSLMGMKSSRSLPDPNPTRDTS